MPDRKTCTHCGTAFDPSEWYPTATSQEGGTLDIHVFCSGACRSAWQAVPVEPDEASDECRRR